MSIAPHVGTASSRRYERRRPEKAPLYKVVAEQLEVWLENRAVAEQPVRQWVASVPKRLRCLLADRPSAVAAITRILNEEIERLLRTAAGLTRDGHRPSEARPRLGAVSFSAPLGDDANSHPRHWYAPKLMMTGRLTGSLSGRPVVVDTDESGLVLTLAAVRSLWTLSTIAGSLTPVLGLLRYNGISIRIRIGRLVTVGVQSQPSALARFFVPRLKHLS